MNALKRLWTQIARFAEALEGIDDPAGDYMLSLDRRIAKLERHVDQLEMQLHSTPRGDAAQTAFP